MKILVIIALIIISPVQSAYAGETAPKPAHATEPISPKPGSAAYNFYDEITLESALAQVKKADLRELDALASLLAACEASGYETENTYRKTNCDEKFNYFNYLYNDEIFILKVVFALNMTRYVSGMKEKARNTKINIDEAKMEMDRVSYIEEKFRKSITIRNLELSHAGKQ